MTEPRGKAYEGTGVTVYFDGARCLHAAECVRGLPDVFDTKQRPWVQPAAADADLVAEVVRRCPSGALHYVLDDGPAEQPDRPTSMHTLPGGALVVRGDLRIDLPDGGELAETRAMLCLCGRTGNTPFCDNACTREPPG